MHIIFMNWLNIIYFISPKYELPTVQRDHDGLEDEGIQKYSMENEEVKN